MPLILFADPEHVTTDVLHQSQLSPQTSISTIQVTAANQTPSQTMVTEVANTPRISDTNLSVDTVQVQNNDAEQSITIADNALNVANANNGLENKNRTEQQAQPSVSQIANDDTVKREAGSTQQQPVVIVRQVQMPKTYSGNTSWKGYKEHFERIAAINGWITNAEKVQYLTISPENPASDILRDVNEKSENAYNDIWSALARRFGMLDGSRKSMRRFDARRQNENETLVEYE